MTLDLAKLADALDEPITIRNVYLPASYIRAGEKLMAERTIHKGDGFTMTEIESPYLGRSFCGVQWYRSRGLWWFRVFGFGMLCKDTERHPLLYSQRQPRRDVVRWGKWYVQLLRRGR